MKSNCARRYRRETQARGPGRGPFPRGSAGGGGARFADAVKLHQDGRATGGGSTRREGERATARADARAPSTDEPAHRRPARGREDRSGRMSIQPKPLARADPAG